MFLLDLKVLCLIFSILMASGTAVLANDVLDGIYMLNEKESGKAGDDRLVELLSVNDLVLKNLLVNNIDSVMYYLTRIDQLSIGVSDSFLLAKIYFNIAENQNASSMYDRAITSYRKSLQIAKGLHYKDLIRKSYIGIADCHSGLDLYNESIVFLDKAISYATSLVDRKLIVDEIAQRYYIYNCKMLQEQINNNINLAKKYSKNESVKLMDKYFSLAITCRDIKDRAEFFRATQNYISLGELQNDVNYTLLGYRSLVEDALENKEFFQAIYYSFKVVELMESSQDSSIIREFLRNMFSEAYCSNSDFKLIFDYYKEFINNSHNISQVTSFEILSEMIVVQSVPKVFDRQIMFIGYGFGIFLFMSLIVFIVHKHWRSGGRRKSFEPVNKSMGDKNTIVEVSDDFPVVDRDRENRDIRSCDLFNKLSELVEAEKLFLKPNLCQQEIVTKLGTNKSYLYQAIKMNSNHNFNSFINEFRINYARQIIKERIFLDTQFALSGIYEECGFSTVETMYRCFRNSCGITPGEFAKQQKNMARKRH